MNWLYAIPAAIVALSLLIVVHEFGHYWVARLCNVKVLRFSLGFGKPLFMRRWGRDSTEWVVAAIPLGGFVKMVDERESDVAPEDLPRAFNRQSVGKRFAIVLAGPVANFLLAILLYWGLFLNGMEDLQPILSEPVAQSMAAESGQRAGDKVLSVNNEAVRTRQDLRWHVLQHALDQEEIRLEVLDTQGMRQWRTIPPVPGIGDQPESDILERLGLRTLELPAVIGKMSAGGPAETAGLRQGDRVRSVDGRPIEYFRELAEQVSSAPGKALHFQVERQGVLREVTVTPAAGGPEHKGQGRIGVQPDPDALKEYIVTQNFGALEAFGKACGRTWETSLFSLTALGKMLTGQLSLRNLSGPVTIADYAGQSAQRGWVTYIAFLALISISLGVLNLLPIPLLDGGHLMYYTIEILKGSPLSERVMEIGQRAGLAMLLTLMVFAFYNDIDRLLG